MRQDALARDRILKPAGRKFAGERQCAEEWQVAGENLLRFGENGFFFFKADRFSDACSDRLRVGEKEGKRAVAARIS